ncbi:MULTISPECIES: hypothetical protein [unclassified Streptomyces]|uniref:hypothetical protein n=1 Tax=unclassified Streptomyces TaxID=2593676 RepID=UPI000DAF4761|nr:MULTISPECIES: hypothetical protein [unclassified Streptomyces]PZT76671.1 hypothetical protein DNK56_25575 [Streptomyces sp. AC1-42W]PZT79373.1 hypothetical protein DNK55_07105 [Streptomyces sp. AC1-42T]
MPTFETTARFDRDFKKLLPEERARFQDCVRKKFVPDAAGGRATWQYADEVRAGEPHIVWRRVGGHEIFDPGPA